MSPPRINTFILPDLPWAGLLPTIARDAQPGDVIEVYTEAMRALAEETLCAAGRQDVSVRLRPPAAPPQDQAA